MKIRGLFILFVLALLVACKDGRVYHHYDHTPLAGWDKVDTLIYNVPAVNEEGLYATDLGLRVSNKYPFMSLKLIVEQTIYPSQRKQIDTLTCRLIDSNGKAKGNGVSNYQYDFPVSQMFLHQHDSLHITVRHDMRREIMPGVSDVGISVSNIKK